MKPRTQDQNILQRPKLVPFNPSAPIIDDRWTEFKIVGKNIQSRSHHVAVEYNGHIYVHGGYDADRGILADFYKMDLNGKQDGFRWLALPINHHNYPGKLKSHSAVVYKNYLLIFGGQTVQLKNTNLVWKYNFDTQKWSTIQPSINLPRLDSHKAILNGNFMYVYGGFIDQQACYSSCIYRFDCNIDKWQIVFSPINKKNYPQARGSSSLLLYQDALWIFGGTNGIATLNQMWTFDLKTNEWKQIKSTHVPEPRRSHSMVLCNQFFWMFGGIQDVTKQKNDICIFDPKTKQWTKILNSSNLVYQCSPTMKMQKQSLKRKDSPSKNTKFSLGLSASFVQKQKGDGMKRILQENRQKKFLQKKNQLLKQFVQKANERNDRNLSPTSQSMSKTLQIIGDQQQSKRSFQNEIIYDPSLKFIVGKKPCARDAHSSLIYKQKMLIFGGDRHLMSFADLFFFDIKKGIESKQLYKKHNLSQQE